MFMMKVSTLTGLFVCLIFVMKVDMAFHKFKKIPGMKFKQSIATETVKKSCFMQCALYCTNKQGCVSLSWKPYQTECLLSDLDMTHESEHYSDSLENATGWDTYTMPQHQVFMVQEGGRYTLDFLAATRACNERGTRLASPSDLLAARSNGFNLCQCGWLSDGRNGFVLQAYTSSCWSSFTTDIIICGYSQAGALCFQN